jgi:hypothetical protein
VIKSAPFLRAAWIFLAISLIAVPVHVHGREKNVLQYGAGLIVNIPSPEPEVAQIVQDVAQNTIIRGTKEYNKDEFVSGAVAVSSTPVFPAWQEGGKVFYKVKQQSLTPLNFKNSNDVGTLAVRYVVQAQGENNTVLRIDALFVEDFRHGVHQSNGSVESSEYKDIQDRLQAAELLKKETAEALEAKREHEAKQKFGMGNDTTLLSTPPTTSESIAAGATSSDLPSSNSGAANSGAANFGAANFGTSWTGDSGISLEQHVADLRRQIERLVKAPGAPLKSAPFRTASTMKSLDPGTEVLILILTPYWYGVETNDGQHGWLRRDQLEELR